MARRSVRNRAWFFIRRKLIQARGYKCERCGRGGRLEVHHRIPISKGGKRYDRENLEVICRQCHFDEHRHDREIPGASEWRERIGV